MTPTGFEPVAYRLGIYRSILLSYGVADAYLSEKIVGQKVGQNGGLIGGGLKKNDSV